MTRPSKSPHAARPKRSPHPFRSAVLRGLGIVLPPLLTIVIFLWVWNTVQVYVLAPVETGTRQVLCWYIADVKYDLPPGITNSVHDDKGNLISFQHDDRTYVAVVRDQWIPREVYDLVSRNTSGPMPSSSKGIYERYVEMRYLKRYVVVPVFLCIFILLLYLLGKFLAAGLGRYLWGTFERLIHTLPLVRNVYGSVKQVTDFVFSEREIEYTRVVAVEYPRKGVWSLGFVTGESMLDIRAAANEPVLSLLIPTSPMPATGFTVTVRKSETVDLNLTVDQAVQFIVSCGVVVPKVQHEPLIHPEVSSAVAEHLAAASSPEDGEPPCQQGTVVDPASHGEENGRTP